MSILLRVFYFHPTFRLIVLINNQDEPIKSASSGLQHPTNRTFIVPFVLSVQSGYAATYLVTDERDVSPPQPTRYVFKRPWLFGCPQLMFTFGDNQDLQCGVASLDSIG